MERYRILVRPEGDDSPPASVEQLSSRLLRIPTLERAGERRFRFGDEDEDGRLELELEGGEGDRFERASFSIPRGWVPRKGPQVFALIFMVRDWLGFEAYDPQIDDVLNKEAVLQGLVAMRQAELNQKERP